LLDATYSVPLVESCLLVNPQEEASVRSDPAPDRVRVSGPLTPFPAGFCVHLLEQGYSLWSAQFHLQFLAHVSRWLDAEGLGVSGLTPQAVDRFLAERRRQGYAARLSPNAVRPLLRCQDYERDLRVQPHARARLPLDVLVPGLPGGSTWPDIRSSSAPTAGQ
jgi:hypothetical protein